MQASLKLSQIKTARTAAPINGIDRHRKFQGQHLSADAIYFAGITWMPKMDILIFIPDIILMLWVIKELPSIHHNIFKRLSKEKCL
jgi:hypothetical protein